VTRLIVEKMFQEPIAPGAKELFGDCPLLRFDARAVRILRDRRADRPEAANNRVRRLRRIFKWAVDSGIEGVTVNPARDVALLRPMRTGGFPTWTVADIEKFEKRHPIGSKARLALSLLSYTGVRRSDVVQLGKQHLRNGWLVFRQFKGRTGHR
jgi:integrase